MVVNGTSNVVNYGTCSTAAATAAKVVSCSNFALITGAEITVKFTTTNTASNPTLNVNSTGAKAIYYRGSAISAGYLAANRTYTFRYNGTQYELVGDINTNTTYSNATTSAAGLMSKDDKAKLDAITDSADSVSFSASATSGNKVGTITINGNATDMYSPIQTTVSGNAGTATKLATSRTINVGTAVKGTAKSFNGSKNITIPITSVKEAYLSWGGKNLSGGYSCIDAAMVPDLGANKLAFGKPDGITIQYSTDGGSTWADYGASDYSKVGLFSTGYPCTIGKATKDTITSNCMLRVIIDTDSFGIYSVLNKFIIFISTEGSSGCYCTIDASVESSPTTFTTFADKVPISGWSGYNVINTPDISTYGNAPSNQYGLIRFTFGCTDVDTNYSGLRIIKIMGFGGMGWITPSNMARTGHLYSYDSRQNATFPAKVTATTFDGPLSGNAATASKLETFHQNSTTDTYGTSWNFLAQWITGDRLKFKVINGGAFQDSYPIEVDHAYKLVASSTDKNASTAPLSVGSDTQPIYFSDGVPVAITGTIANSISGNAATASKVNNKLTFGSKTYDGSATVTIAASDLGLASAMLFLGTTTTAITDGATTNPITIGGTSKTVTAGNVVLYGSKEFVWTGSAWELLGDEGSYKVKQAAVADPSASGTASAFIDSISQDANGKITVTKKTVAVTNSAPTLSWGTTSTVGTVAGTNLQVKMPANPTTDTKVTQTATTSDATYPLLLAPNGQTVTTTTSAYFDSGVTLNPSTNTIAANISGNAATATKLGTTTVGSSTKPIYLNNGSPTTCVDFLPLTAGENKKLTGPLGLTKNVNYGASLPAQGFEGQLFFLEEEEKPSLPPGGTQGDILVKISEADGDANWLNPWNEEALTGLSHRGQMTDADLDLKRGLYTFGPNTANTPATGYGCIQNIIANDIAEGVPIGGTTEGSWIWQIGFHTGYPNIFLRNSVNADPFGSWKKVWLEGDAITGAVWNDYAEYRESDCEEFGYVLMETGDDSLTKTTERLSHFAGVSSDTWGFSQGKTTHARTPIAVAGRVLVYPYQDRNNYKPGDCVCAAPGGTVDIMTREEVREWPDRIVGIVSCVPNYEEWGGGECADRDPVKINGRIWIKVK